MNIHGLTFTDLKGRVYILGVDDQGNLALAGAKAVYPITTMEMHSMTCGGSIERDGNVISIYRAWVSRLAHITVCDRDGTYKVGRTGDEDFKLFSTESGEGPRVTPKELYDLIFCGHAYLSKDHGRKVWMESVIF